MSEQGLIKMGRSTSELEEAILKAKEENIHVRSTEVVDPTRIDSLISMLQGQVESLYRAWADLEATLQPTLSESPYPHPSASSPESDCEFGHRLAQIYTQYSELEARIHSTRGRIRL